MVSSTLPTLLCSASPVLDQKFQEEASRKGLLPAYAVAFAQFAEKYADLDAIVYDGVGHAINFTYRDIERSSNRLARNLAKFDVGAGDLIVTVAENRPEMAVLVLACMKLGSTFVPLASDLRIKDLHTVVAMYSPKLIVCDQPDYGPFLTPEGDQRQTILLPPFRAGDNILKTLMAEGSGAPLEVPQVSPNKASIIFSTSGSTGLPKGVMYSSESISRLADPTLLAVMQAQAPGEKVLMWVSMRGVCGTIMMLKHFLEGACMIMVDTYPSGPTLWSQLIDKHGIESFVLFGAAMNQMLQELPDRKFESVKKVTYGGSCFAPALVQHCMDQFPNANISQGYGMTENLMMCTLAPQFHKRSGEASAEDLLRMSSAGQVMLPDDLFIEDLDRPGSCLPPPLEKNGVGQICSRSGLMMMGYYANSEKTKEVMPDGKFVRTGDVGRISEDGFVYILGRIKEIIPTCKGFNVMPRDIEEVLYQHAAVGQASVVGICHPSGAGEAVVASVSVKAGCELSAADVKEHCKQLGMPTWQMPDAIHVVDGGLPTIGSKIAKQVLQSHSFRKGSLVAELVRARSKVSRQAMSEETANQGDGAHLSELDILFGDAVAALNGSKWQELLPCMTKAEREFFILSARSLLASNI
mmetsp:Transcript_21039/g.68133  ORF Transcript_21039/g.68133 Transcript_21039/m.68133 type:complete len:638 (+) Transcript_21039:66-1979(+)